MPFVAIGSVVVATLFEPSVVTAIVVLIVGGLLMVQVVLGWKLVDDLGAMRTRHAPPAG